MGITIRIETDNAAFDDPDEIVRILGNAATRIRESELVQEANRTGWVGFGLRDVNGNQIGEVRITD